MRATSCGVVVTLAALLAGGVTAQSARPNIVLIMADDMGYADVGHHGSSDIRTPALDALARTGVRFSQAYVSSSICAPSRAGLMTGRYQQRFGFEFNMEARHRDAGLPVSETTLAARLKPAGYTSALIGKWHLGNTAPFHPLNRGFDEFYGFLGGIHSYTTAGSPGPLWDGRKRTELNGYLTDEFSIRAVDFIERHRNQPFFLYLAYSAPHVPLEAPPSYLARVSHIQDEPRRIYAAMVTAMDDGIARVMKALRDNGLERKTLVIFLNDNGGPVAGPGLLATDNPTSNSPLRGAKGQLYEGGVRVPLIFSWPGRLPAGKVDARPVIQLDIYPTVLAAARVRIDPQWQLDGVDLLSFINSKAGGEPHPVLYWRFGVIGAIRQGQWKLVREFEDMYALMQATGKPIDWSKAALYDLSADPGEQADLASQYPAKVAELAKLWQRWNSTLAEPKWAPFSAGQ